MVNVGEAYGRKKNYLLISSKKLCGLVLYSAYASTVTQVLPGNLEIYGYVEDHAIKVSSTCGEARTQNSTLGTLEPLLIDIRKWMNENRLKINDSKTEIIIFGTRQHKSNS